MSEKEIFLQALQSLQSDYPEYSDIVRSLIEKLEQGREVEVQEALKKLQSEVW